MFKKHLYPTNSVSYHLFSLPSLQLYLVLFYFDRKKMNSHWRTLPVTFWGRGACIPPTFQQPEGRSLERAWQTSCSLWYRTRLTFSSKILLMSELEFLLLRLWGVGGGVGGTDSLRLQIGPLAQHGVLADPWYLRAFPGSAATVRS